MIRRVWKLPLFVGALAIGGLLGAKAFPETVVGSGNSARDYRSVGPVTEVIFSGTGNLTVVQGDTPDLLVTADDNLLPYLVTQTSGRRLHIHTRSGYRLQPHAPITYTLTVPKLERVSVSGSGSVKMDALTGDSLSLQISGSGHAALRDLALQNLGVSISGSGTASATGTATKLTVRVSGSGEFDGAALMNVAGDVRVSGSGNVSVWSVNALKARVSGSGDVRYKGTPKLEKKVSGSGSVKRSDA
jgi:hypothetical protein